MQAPFCANEMLNSLENCRIVEIRAARGIRSNNLIYQMRRDGANRWMFLAHVNPMKNQDIPKPSQNTISLNDYWKLTLYDTLTGETKALETVNSGGKTNLTMTRMQISRFRSPVLKVELDGEEVGHIAFSPYGISLGQVQAGVHQLKITSFGNRVNTFGAVHNCNEVERWFGPNAWRSTKEEWSYEYFIKETGILKAPEIYVVTDKNA